MLERTTVSALVLLLAAAAGCAGKDEKEPARSEPQQQCDTLMQHWCTRAMGCAVDASLVQASDEQHQESLCFSTADGLCDRAVGIESGYDECIAEIDVADCGPIVTAIETNNSSAAMLPSVCAGVVTVN